MEHIPGELELYLDAESIAYTVSQIANAVDTNSQGVSLTVIGVLKGSFTIVEVGDECRASRWASHSYFAGAKGTDDENQAATLLQGENSTVCVVGCHFTLDGYLDHGTEPAWN